MFKAGFLTIQHFVIIPSTQPLSAYAEGKNSANEQTQNVPVQLDIPEHQISLPTLPGSITNGEWQVSTQGVSLLSPEQLGQVTSGYVLYGHDWPILLGRMRQAKIGEEITLTFRDGAIKKYKITTVFNVSPKQVDILSMAKPDTLLIYTCNGVLDSQRLVVLAQEQVTE